MSFLGKINPRIVQAKYIKDFKIFLKFKDGTEGIADFAPFLSKTKAEVYQPLKQTEIFKRVKIDEFGVLSWMRGNIDFPIEFLQEIVQKEPIQKKPVTGVTVIAMPLLAIDKVDGSLLYMYFYDIQKHKEPHFHVKNADGDAVIRIRDFHILECTDKKMGKSLKDVLKWAKQHQSEIQDAWNAAVKGHDIFRIQPPVAIVDGYEIRIYAGDMKQRQKAFMRVWKKGIEHQVLLGSLKGIAEVTPGVADWIKNHKEDLYEKWALSLLNQRMGKIK